MRHILGCYCFPLVCFNFWVSTGRFDPVGIIGEICISHGIKVENRLELALCFGGDIQGIQLHHPSDLLDLNSSAFNWISVYNSSGANCHIQPYLENQQGKNQPCQPGSPPASVAEQNQNNLDCQNIEGIFR